MAKGQRVGFTSTTIGMVAFAALWLASSVFLIFLYTGQEALKNDNERLAAENSRLISSNEQRSIELVKSAREGGPTVVGLIEGARSQTAQMATGEPPDSPATVRTKKDQLLRTIREEGLVAGADSFVDLSYHEALTRLYSAHKAVSDVRRAAEERASQLEGEVTKLVEADAAGRTTSTAVPRRPPSSSPNARPIVPRTGHSATRRSRSSSVISTTTNGGAPTS